MNDILYRVGDMGHSHPGCAYQHSSGLSAIPMQLAQLALTIVRTLLIVSPHLHQLVTGFF